MLQIGLDKQNLEHKKELIQFCMSIRGNVKEDLTSSTPLIHYVEKHKCSLCSQPANINCISCFGKDIWICIDDLKNHKIVH